jgi:hypothetical protein
MSSSELGPDIAGPQTVSRSPLYLEVPSLLVLHRYDNVLPAHSYRNLEGW